jgi:hypothetical protein
MHDDFALKPIHADAIPQAIRKAEQYRRLNEPGQAESICLDILAIDSENQDALRLLILALTDKFSRSGGSVAVDQARRHLQRLTAEYDRNYYAGIICEREAKAHLGRGRASTHAYDGFRRAMDHYQKAEALRPPGNDDAILRWNACVRAIRRERLRPREEETRELPLE